MIHLHGAAPYHAVTVHGGPGAIGSLQSCSEELAKHAGVGVVEALQSKYSVDELIDELHEQTREHCTTPAVLIGHSWGAWLAALTTAKYPDIAAHVVLVGCPPLDDSYVEQITERRMAHMNSEDRTVFQTLLEGNATDDIMAAIPSILERVDNVALIDDADASESIADARMYNEVWSQAAAMRSDCSLLKAFGHITCPITVIQGDSDPHPLAGVTEPLDSAGISYNAIELAHCGHSPFFETQARAPFFEALARILA